MRLGRWLTISAVAMAGCAQPAPSLAPATVPGVTAQATAISDETIVRLHPGVAPLRFARRHGLQWVRHLGLDMHLYSGKATTSLLAEDAEARWAEPNTRLSLPPLQTAPAPRLPARSHVQRPNDPLLPAQYGLTITGTDKAWTATKGKGVVVAVIDSGIDGQHPEFQGQLLKGMDFTGKTPVAGGDTDGYGHGTHVAGVIGARQGNGEGISGVAPDCKLLPVRIFNDHGHSTGGVSAQAVIWAVDHGAQVINASWGSPMISETDKTAYAYAFSKGVAIVAAVGNSANDDPKYPGAHPGIIAVAGSTDIDTWASFSTYGDWVSVAAPGEGILSTFPLSKGNGYRIMRGTSMAAPLVSGAVALLKSRHPQLGLAEIQARLESTAKDIVQPGKDKYSGHGRVDVGRALLDPLR